MFGDDRDLAEGVFWERRYGQQHIYVHQLEDEVARLRQGLWDCATAAGGDGDGCQSPAQMVYPDIVAFAVDAVRELMRDYEEAIGHVCPPPRPGQQTPEPSE